MSAAGEITGVVGYGVFAMTACFVGASMYFLLDSFGERMIQSVRNRV